MRTLAESHNLLVIWLILTVALLVVQHSHAQEWVRRVATNYDDPQPISTIDSQNNFITAAKLAGTVMLDDFTYYSGVNTDSLLVTKYLSGPGTYYFSIIIGRCPGSTLVDIIVDDKDEIYLVATVRSDSCQYYSPLPPNTLLGTQNDIVLIKMNTQGLPLWSRVLSSTADDEVGSIAFDNSTKSIVIAGVMGADTSVGSEEVSAGTFIASYGTDGSLKDIFSFGPNGRVDKLLVDKSGSWYLLGYTNSNATFDGLLISDHNNQPYYYVVKFEETFGIWIQKMSGFVKVSDMIFPVDNQNTIVLGGYFSGFASIGSTPVSYTGAPNGALFSLYTSTGSLAQFPKVVYEASGIYSGPKLSATSDSYYLIGTYIGIFMVEGTAYFNTQAENSLLIRHYIDNSTASYVLPIHGGVSYPRILTRVHAIPEGVIVGGITYWNSPDAFPYLPSTQFNPSNDIFYAKFNRTIPLPPTCITNNAHPFRFIAGFASACLCTNKVTVYGANCTQNVELLSPNEQFLKINDRLKLAVNMGQNTTSLRYMWLFKTPLTQVEQTVHVALSSYVKTPANSTFLVLDAEGISPSTIYTFSFVAIDVMTNVMVYTKEFKVTKLSEPIYLQEGGQGIEVLQVSSEDDLLPQYRLSAINWNPVGVAKRSYSFAYFDNETDSFVSLCPYYNTSSIVVALPFSTEETVSLVLQIMLRNEYGNQANATKVISIAPRNVKNPEAEFSQIDNLINQNSETNTIALAKYVDTRLGQVKISDNWKNVVSKMLNNSVDNVVNLNSAAKFMDNIPLYLSSAEILTRNTQVQTEKTIYAGIEMINQLISKSSSLQSTTSTLYKSLFDKSSFESSAQVLSNIAGKQDRESAALALSATFNLAKEKLSELLLSEDPSTIVTQNVFIKVQAELTQALLNTTISTRDSTLSIPDTFEQETGQSILKYVMVVLSDEKNPFKFASLKNEQVSDLTDLTFIANDGSNLPVANLAKPLQLSFPRPQPSDDSKRVKAFECRFWNETEERWSTDGCRLVSATNRTINCECSHTTSFSAFIIYHDNSVRTPKVYIAGIVFNSFYIIICTAIIIGLIVCFKTQPVRSRFIAPYIGISAVLLDALLNGIARNGLLIGNASIRSINSLSYVIMILSNPLTLLAMFIFVWQYVRFILSQNIYFIMSKHKENSKYNGTRIITSKLVYILSVIVAYIIWFIIFGGMVVGGLSAKGTTKEQRETRANNITIGAAILFSAGIITMGVILLVVLVVDLIISFLRAKQDHQKVENPDAQTSEQNKKKEENTSLLILKDLILGDPLLFRIEAMLILLTILILLLLYPIGIASEVTSTAGTFALIVLRVLLEILFMLCKIFSFGGFICLIAVKNLSIRTYRGYSKHKDEKEEISHMEEFLKLEAGYKAMFEYCIKEMSLENLLLYSEIGEIKSKLLQNGIEKELPPILAKLTETYVKSGSPCEVNLSHKVKKSFIEIYEKPDLTVDLCNNAINYLLSDTMANLDDTFSRFTSTTQYLNVISASKTKDQELKEFTPNNEQ